MTPNEREWGTVTARLDQAVHTQRNMRMILNGVVDDCNELRASVARLQIILRTVLSVLAVTVAALAWVVELVMR